MLFHWCFRLKVRSSQWEVNGKRKSKKGSKKKKKKNLILFWYGDNWEIWDGNMMPGVTFLCLFSASDLPLCAGHTWLLSTDSKVSRHAAACHSAASQTRQCDVGSPITWSLPYLRDPIFIFPITPTAQNKAGGLCQLFWRISEIYNGFPKTKNLKSNSLLPDVLWKSVVTTVFLTKYSLSWMTIIV